MEPLEPGYGHTLGNAMRRALLTSIPGAAITSVKISGVKHKFSTVPGVKENVVDLLLNIKGLNFRFLDGETKSRVSLSVKGPKKITGADFDLPGNIEIVNKDHYAASINDKKAKLEMELIVEEGLGYSSAEERRTTQLGVIPTDAVFTPVKKVSYEVTATRVGRQTDLDKLCRILEVTSNYGKFGAIGYGFYELLQKDFDLSKVPCKDVQQETHFRGRGALCNYLGEGSGKRGKSSRASAD